MWRTLGVVRYRAGDWKGAITALEKAEQLHGRGDETIRLFLAMAYWREGSRDRAQNCYSQALEPAKGNESSGATLRRYRAEAAKLLGKSGPPGPNSKEEAPPPKKSR
jgi:tetratricopeptide (TPR) repeat protein